MSLEERARPANKSIGILAIGRTYKKILATGTNNLLIEIMENKPWHVNRIL